ncbi:MAG: hypothetical protein WCG66_05700 [bacterium]
MAWKKATLILLAAGVPLLFAEPARVANASLAASSSSRSGVFIAYSQDRNLRNQMLRSAESVMVEWEKIHSTGAGFSAPIILNDKTSAPPPKGVGPVVPLIFETEVGMKAQVDLYDATAIRSGAFDAGVFTALALQFMHGEKPLQTGRALAMPPGWFIEGLAEEVRRSRDGVPEGIYSALFQTDRPPDLEAFLRMKPGILDAASIVIYRAQAVSLLRILKKSKEGQSGFVAWLDPTSPSKTDSDRILAAFPSLGSRSNLTKLWTLDLAGSSNPPTMASLTVKQSDAELADILDTVGGPEKIGESARARGGAYLLRECTVRLFNLEFRAHPLLQPVVSGYRELAMQLTRRPKSSTSRQIEQLEKQRQFVTERAEKIADYLNWFEVARLDAPPSEFHQARQDNDRGSKSTPYSLHLDSIEARGW